MSMPEIQVDGPRKKGFFVKFLDRVEKYGNKLPDVLTLFLIIIIAVLLLSTLAASLGWSTVNPTTNEKIVAVNLLSGEGIIKILTEMVNNFTSFPPLGLVLAVMLGVGLAETTGLISTAMKKTVLLSPKQLILPIIVLVSLLGHVAADAAFIVMPPIAAMIFIMVGRHPVAGLAAAYAAVAGGFSANLLLSVVDVLLASFTETGAKLMDPNFVANPAMNYYFMAASTIMLIPLTVYVTTKIVEPRLGTYSGSVEIQAEMVDITKEEKRGLPHRGIPS